VGRTLALLLQNRSISIVGFRRLFAF